MRAIEKLIARRVIQAMLTVHPKVIVDIERGFDPVYTIEKPEDIDAAMDDVFSCDEVWLMADGNADKGYGSYVWLIYGNGNGGLDVISDYTTNLDGVLQPVLDMIDELDKGELELEVRS